MKLSKHEKIRLSSAIIHSESANLGVPQLRDDAIKNIRAAAADIINSTLLDDNGDASIRKKILPQDIKWPRFPV